MIADMYIVQRHPRELMAMKPPTKGAAKGPMKTAMQKIDMITPRCALLKRSAKTAGTIEIGLAANNPAKKRHIMIVCISFATAQAMVNKPQPKRPIERGPRRPISSDAGAQMVGPAANPST
jgi:hypothetical protein